MLKDSHSLIRQLESLTFSPEQDILLTSADVAEGTGGGLTLSLANQFGPDPPFRVETDYKTKIKLCILLPSCSPRCPDTREIIIGG
jgi:hypothetical protein